MNKKTKYCPVCDEILSIELFGNNATTKDKLTSICKSCKIHSTLRYQQTKHGLISTIYAQQKHHSKQRGHNTQSYSKKYLLNWLLNDWYFNFLFEQWSNCNHLSILKPSIDRINNDLGYTSNNITITTWGLNRSRQIYIDNKYNASIICKYDLNNNLINTYKTITEASLNNNIDRGNLSKKIKLKSIYHGYLYIKKQI